MKRGAIRRLNWGPVDAKSVALQSSSGHLAATTDLRRDEASVEIEGPVAGSVADVAAESIPTLDPPPATAEEEAIALLRVAAEVEGALMVQYLFAAGSLLPNISVDVPDLGYPIISDDWYDLIRDVAKQEMGHLMTVQNLLLSLGAPSHVDRENLPLESPLYPFPFTLQPAHLTTLARFVCAEAPRMVAGPDATDYAAATALANAGGNTVSRVGQIYERLFWLFQDGAEPQQPWPDLENPFPHWPPWHVDPARVGLNVDLQADPVEWRGSDGGASPDTAIYVLQVRDKASARGAIFKIGLQGEGPTSDPGITHFDKFLRIFREQQIVGQQPGAPVFVRNQADDPRTGLSGAATITDPKALAWAQLANVRYHMMLMDIALATSLNQADTAPGTTATRANFTTWAFSEMLATVKPLTIELRQMPLSAGANPDDVRAGIPYELPNQSLPVAVTDRLAYLRSRIVESDGLRSYIAQAFNPSPKQQKLLAYMASLDASVAVALG
jgi:hypothetical protein